MKNNEKKLRKEIFLPIIGIIVGVIWFILGWEHIAPGTGNKLALLVTMLISVGIFGGIAVISFCTYYLYVAIRCRYPN